MAGTTTPAGPLLRALVVDDEAPALSELAGLLGRDPRIGRVRTACTGPEALRVLDCEPVDVVFCDVRMPGLAGPDLVRGLARCASPPQVVLVTAFETPDPGASGLRPTDHVTKPVRPRRLAEAVSRVVETTGGTSHRDDETITVELAGVTRAVQRSQVRYVEAQGDYARLHTATGSHLVRIPLATLETRWADAGFVRIHRSTLVALPHVDEVRVDAGRWSVRLGDRVLGVSRRHSRQLRDRLTGAGTPGETRRDPGRGPDRGPGTGGRAQRAEP